MENGTVTFRRLATMVLNELPPDERTAVRQQLAALPHTPSADWTRLAGDQHLYLVPITDSLRAFVRAAPGEPVEIQDIVHRETLELFAKSRN